MDSYKDRQHPGSDGLDRALTDLYRIQTPQGFDAAWRGAVRREELKQMKPSAKGRIWRAALPAFGALVLVVGTLLTGAGELGALPDRPESAAAPMAGNRAAKLEAYDGGGSSASQSMDSAYEGGASGGYGLTGGPAPAPMAEEAATAAPEAAQAKKIVRTADITLASTAFDADQQAIREKVAQAGGYVQSVYQYEGSAWEPERRVYFTLRIPTEKLDEFLSGVAGIGRVTARSENSQDMTVQYSDTALRLATQQEKMKRLQQLLTQAESVSDLLEIETEIANTQYQIDQYETSLRSIDREVEQSQVSVTLVEETPAQSAAQSGVSLGERLARGLAASWEGIGRFFQNMLVFLVMAMPVLVPLLAIWIVARVILRRKGRGPEPRKNHKKEEETK